ncbi:DUF21 domain-containing protein [Aestuariibacter sp. GS-14]|uniref:CNNM domain-containing protein n=1 Tax=Aestuariibacter sp. GS-14 TaxID=2590670 RepID=UPI00112B8E41|nr:CNNM domain-containing protein [Aestuariibacter sp. GS-14]TPV58319.1 DUF21 domain-containing protein [Aestuariibacter sp. GS-14]
MNTVIWLGIALYLVQSALFSGLNLAYFSVSRMRLEVENANGNPHAQYHHHMQQPTWLN